MLEKCKSISTWPPKRCQHFWEANSVKYLGLGPISPLSLFGIFRSLPFSFLPTLSLYTCERVAKLLLRSSQYVFLPSNGYLRCLGPGQSSATLHLRAYLLSANLIKASPFSNQFSWALVQRERSTWPSYGFPLKVSFNSPHLCRMHLASTAGQHFIVAYTTLDHKRIQSSGS